MSLVQNFNNFNYLDFNEYLYFKIIDSHVGYVNKNFANYLNRNLSNYFSIDNKNLILKNFSNSISYNNITNFFNELAKVLLKSNFISKITNEFFDVISLDNFQYVCKIDRSLLSLFGVVSRGIHLNGYVKKNNKIYLWIAKRSKSKLLYPGKLDNITAGGVSHGYSVLETLFKEALEEASIENTVVKNSIFTTKLHYYYPILDGIRNDIMYIYNLELPLDFTPQKNDGEVETFLMLEAEEVFNILKNSCKFKFNSAISIIYFLIEKGIINNKNTNDKDINFIKNKFNEMNSSRILQYL